MKNKKKFRLFESMGPFVQEAEVFIIGKFNVVNIIQC
jgi:hypothetical protein